MACDAAQRGAAKATTERGKFERLSGITSPVNLLKALLNSPVNYGFCIAFGGRSRDKESMQANTQEIPSRDTAETEREKGTHYPLALWLKMKADFVTGKGSLLELCAKHGMNYNAVLGKSSQQKWGKLREKWLAKRSADFEAATTIEHTPEPVRDTAPIQDQAAILKAHIARIDLALAEAFIARDVADLTKARATLMDQLYLAQHGTKPGIAKPGKRSNRPAMPQPEPQPDTLPVVFDSMQPGSQAVSA